MPAIAPNPAAPVPGWLALHGNRLELLADALAAWLGRHPLSPLQHEVLLVQSNGMAEWLKIALAERLGVCAGVQVALPAQFLWSASRQVLGPDAVPAQSPLDEAPLTWRLMALLRPLAGESSPAVFAPLVSFLRDGNPARELQLARQLADLFDQYQVYRADWLQAWSEGRDLITDPAGRTRPLPSEQAWQPALWRALLATLPPGGDAASRPRLQQRFISALQAAAPGTLPLPPRVVLFGATHLAPSVMPALAALARHSQVVMALPNPCRWHWAETMAGREWLAAQRRRQPLRGGRDLAAVPLQAMHLHAHPLLAAWGRQQRDFLRALEAFDDAELACQRFGVPRVDLFDEEAPDTGGLPQLRQLQAHIRELLPLAETPRTALRADDRSIVFHSCHGALREVEVLHDQLLHALSQPAAPGEAALQPRDIVVMVPDIAVFAPVIEAVFGALPPDDPRHIPYGISDLQERGHHPLLRTLEWLLRLPQQRCTLAELHDLLDVPAVAARFDLDPAALPTLTRWMQQVGIRWGLDANQRRALGLPADDDVHTWAWGLRRMLLGYALGADPDDAEGESLWPQRRATPQATPGDEALARLAAVAPFDEVSGLDAACVGALADLLRALQAWARWAQRPVPPARWARRGRALLQFFFRPAGDTAAADARLLRQADEALQLWAAQCAEAGLDRALPLEVLREAWLPALQSPDLHRRFRAGGVTFCTLMPLRAVPFEMVCLLGMNEADYPRRATRSDFDLLADLALARPGDRARRDDDRQLMLEALLSARRALHVSWTGRSARDATVLPPSVLVTQLREHLAAVWGEAALQARTVHHPLQPFARRQFESGDPWCVSHANEWRLLHEPTPAGDAAPSPSAPPSAPAFAPDAVLTLDALVRFLRHPAREFFRLQLQVVFDELPPPLPQDEPFALEGLVRWQQAQDLLDMLQRAADAGVAPDTAAERLLPAALDRLQRGGAMPPGAPGRAARAALQAALQLQWSAWCALRQDSAAEPVALPVHAVCLASAAAPVATQGAPEFVDLITGLRRVSASGALQWHALDAGRLLDHSGAPRLKSLLPAWVRQLAAAAAGRSLSAVLVGHDAVLTLAPPCAETAPQALQALCGLWQRGQAQPLPLPWASATLRARGDDDEPVARRYDGDAFRAGEREDPVLARLWPDSDALLADPAFDDVVDTLLRPLLAHAAEHAQIASLLDRARAPSPDLGASASALPGVVEPAQ